MEMEMECLDWRHLFDVVVAAGVLVVVVRQPHQPDHTLLVGPMESHTRESAT